jgi:hypothetical protein
MPRRVLRGFAALCVLSLLIVSCSHKKKSAEPSPTSAAPTTTSPTPKPSKSPGITGNPFTGRPGTPQPVLAIKVDNAPAARPQAGLDYADLVYEELVEGGATRFLAVFASRQAPRIEPVRSARESDIELLKQYGKVIFAYSGGNTGVITMVEHANLFTANAKKMGQFNLDFSRHRPYNTYVAGADLIRAFPGAAKAQDIGLRFGNRFAGARIERVTIPFSPLVTTSFLWDGSSKRWLRSTNGRPAILANGARMASPNVVVQYVQVHPSRFVDRAGNNTPYSITTGKGDAIVLRDGKYVRCRWTRPNAASRTRFVDAKSGKDVLLAPGPVWFLLARTGTRVALG